MTKNGNGPELPVTPSHITYEIDDDANYWPHRSGEIHRRVMLSEGFAQQIELRRRMQIRELQRPEPWFLFVQLYAMLEIDASYGIDAPEAMPSGSMRNAVLSIDDEEPDGSRRWWAAIYPGRCYR